MLAGPSPVDALAPPEMAERAEAVGVAKAALPARTTFVLAVLAGAFIALGGMFSTTVAAGGPGGMPWGVWRLVVGTAFSLGLVLVLVGGAELFTGNVLMVMAWSSRKLRAAQIARNWVLVLAGNAVGALGTALLGVLAGHHLFHGGAVGLAALATADAKCDLDPVRAFALGILCNTLVCLAVWLNMSARTATDRVLVTVPPIAAFVACGFEHSVANLYLVPSALFARDLAGFAPTGAAGAFPHLAWDRFLVGNLLPVTAGNLVGGAVLVGAVYAFVYLRRR